MKHHIIFTTTLLGLAACTQQAPVPEPTVAQQRVAMLAYEHLRDGQYDAFVSHLEPELQRYFQDNQKMMRQFAYDIPKQAYKSQTLMRKQLEDSGQYKYSYEITYPNNLVQYDVSFKPESSHNKIQNLNIRVYGE